jgi:hypothetical protein
VRGPDLLDVKHNATLSDKLGFIQELEAMLRELKNLGIAVYAATRSAKFTNDSWTSKTPMPLTVGYLAAVPMGPKLVPRRLGGL